MLVRFFSFPFFLAVWLFLGAAVPAFAQKNSNEGAPQFFLPAQMGHRPNTPFSLLISVTGKQAIHITTSPLPEGLVLDEASGLLSGRVKQSGSYTLEIIAENPVGKATHSLRLSIGDTLCLTPPMGWNSWNVFTKDIDENMLMQMADAMVATGMRDAGYQYINIDDFWHAETREADGRPKADPKKFPHGMKYLADYVHARGLKLGIYSCAGDKTCGKCFGGFSYEEIDAKTYAEWGIDLLKYDYCFAPWSRKAAQQRYQKMGSALKNSGRTIVFSVCEWGLRQPWKWARAAGGSYWRITPDIFDVWKGGNPWQMSVMRIVKKAMRLKHYNAPGGWNDPDMLLVGNNGQGKATSGGGTYHGMTPDEYRAHFALWCALRAPLLASCDLRSISRPDLELLTDPKLLKWNQQAVRPYPEIAKKGKLFILSQQFNDGTSGMMYFNSGEKDITVPEIGIVRKHAVVLK
ncbi:MAG: putative Ig domain-containing protein [Chitinophagales bacterium]